ncbi:hypothetical protein NHX12_017837 [Muraenolepis orangiensis]|uniref:Reverse transcriptase domain-containing protein n=1 Tax=Muraenolepis orangiensis TaxID=630683 RepID=A0A9Q0IY27_9TELE|nr:hypothetical protein NHX12_017837 [Muraenolepis orangiensis]
MIFLDVFNESLASGSMPVSCRRAVITLLPKKGNLQDIKNWRPVSLLCVDYKLLSKALATRLGRAVEQVIHRDQTYCVPGRSMVDNVHLIRDVLEVSSSLDINTGLISLDQEKAFDRVEHSFLWKVMEKFGFSAGFIAKIMVLYNNIESVLKFNGGLCAPFRVCRGVRQGCALSGMLYALSLEPLLSKIRSKLQGLFLPGFNGNLVLSAYADDVVVFVRDQTDIDVLVDIVREFSSASAARVNWKKSEALAVGEWSGGLPVLPQNMVWRKDGFKLDVSNSETPGLTVALCRSKTLCLQQLVDAVGPELSDAQALGSLLGLHSVRVAQRILQLWSQILCPEEKRLLRSYGQGGARPDPADPFPEIYLSPGLGELTGPLLQTVEAAGCREEAAGSSRNPHRDLSTGGFVQSKLDPLLISADISKAMPAPRPPTPGAVGAGHRRWTMDSPHLEPEDHERLLPRDSPHLEPEDHERLLPRDSPHLEPEDHERLLPRDSPHTEPLGAGGEGIEVGRGDDREEEEKGWRLEEGTTGRRRRRDGGWTRGRQGGGGEGIEVGRRDDREEEEKGWRLDEGMTVRRRRRDGGWTRGRQGGGGGGEGMEVGRGDDSEEEEKGWR